MTGIAYAPMLYGNLSLLSTQMSIAVHSAGDFVTGAVEYGAQAAAKTVVEQIKGADSFLHSTVQAIATALPKNNTMLKAQHQLFHISVPAACSGCCVAL